MPTWLWLVLAFVAGAAAMLVTLALGLRRAFRGLW